MADQRRTARADIADTGERIIPTANGEVSVIFERSKFAYEYARAFVLDRDVIDVGCGAGYGSALLAETARRVLGLDSSAEAISYCRSNYSAENLEFRQSDGIELDAVDVFDVCVSFQVIEHVRDTDDFMRRLKLAVRSGGAILISTPNVQTFHAEGDGNPFHVSEMDYTGFDALISRHFSDYRILGIGRPVPNRLRSLLSRLPFYQRLGLRLRRGSRLKKMAVLAMDAARFGILEERVAERSYDLLAVCRKEADA